MAESWSGVDGERNVEGAGGGGVQSCHCHTLPQIMLQLCDQTEQLLGHSGMGWGINVSSFLGFKEAAAVRLVCLKLREAVDSRWPVPDPVLR